MAQTQAIVTGDGEVLSKGYMDQYLTKSKEEAGSNQMVTDVFNNAYTQDGLVQPLYVLENLAHLLEISTPHYRACKTKARDTAGIGWYLEPVQDLNREPSEEQKEAATTFLKRPNPDESLSEMAEKVFVDFESTGNGDIEVIRDPNTGLVSHLLHIPSHTVRAAYDGRRFVQSRNGRQVWFKKFGEKEELDARTGVFRQVESDEHRATEIIHLKNYTSRSDYYGIPDIMPALSAVIGDRERQEYNISFFNNHAVPAYAVTVTGAELDSDTERKIEEFFKSGVKDHNHSTLVLAASREEGEPKEEPIKFDFQALSTDTKEASFRMFRQDNRDEILSAHGVPPYRAGIVVEGQLGGSSAQETTEIYKQSVIAPKQERFEDVMNRVLDEAGVTEWQFRLNQIDTRDVTAEVKRYQQLMNLGVYSPNDLREAFGEERIDDPAMDQHFIGGRPVSSSGGRATQGEIKSTKDLHDQLVAIATKEA
ncbi:phage portal protein [Marinococcus luteus]|uniref:phage portal protein n=1 Tax=Marinococcus luteus TaxID=1122204 RepID=UPI002ACC9A55|nr:phage portal protein [Marinococcus luteus]MDZ5782101.1 phage portal protein [Marinococcus luteus]